jgi:ubiquinone/menaquinone biosynthesis C-methylase UbiE
MPHTQDADPHARMRQLIMGFRASQLIYVAAKLGLADELANAPRNAAALATAVGAAPEPLYRLLRALASIGVLQESPDRTFALTPLAHPLRSDAPGSLRSTAVLYGDAVFWNAYGQMLHSIHTGEPAFEHVHGEPMYMHLASHPATASLFHEAMSGFSQQEIAAILEAYDFSSFTTIVDVGGGQGALVAALLKTYSHLRAVVLDREDVAAGAGHLLAQAGLTERASFVAGDFFQAIPRDGSAYLLKSVIHNWDDAAAQKILQNCRRAMSANARLIVIERVIPAANTPSEAKLFDINMLVTVGGQERTEDEHRALLQTSGFDLARIIPTASPLSLIEGVPRPD